MKKVTLTEKQLADIVSKVIKEQEEEGDEHLDVHTSDMGSINMRVQALEEKVNELEADYVRKIGYGDHHDQAHSL